MVGIRSFPFGARPIFGCENVSFRECIWNIPSKIEWDLTNGPRFVSCDRAIRDSGFFRAWVRPLEISSEICGVLGPFYVPILNLENPTGHPQCRPKLTLFGILCLFISRSTPSPDVRYRILLGLMAATRRRVPHCPG